MTNEKILTKAIEKAEENGYVFWNVNPKYVKLSQDYERFYYKKSPYNFYASVHATIFSHDFAKAFWAGLEDVYRDDGDYWIPAWQFHLQQMVLEEEPIKYLEQFLA